MLTYLYYQLDDGGKAQQTNAMERNKRKQGPKEQHPHTGPSKVARLRCDRFWALWDYIPCWASFDNAFVAPENFRT